MSPNFSGLRRIARIALVAAAFLLPAAASADYTVDANQPIVISDDIYDRTTDVDSNQGAEE